MNSPTTTLDTFASRLRYAREVRGLSRRALSINAGLSEAHVGIIERTPKFQPKIGTACAVAEALGVSVEWLVTGTGEAPVT